MDSLLGNSIISGAATFLRLQSGGSPEKTTVARASSSNGVQQPPKESATSSTPSALPLPSSRSSLPGPLKYLWFSKQSSSQDSDSERTEQVADPFSVAGPVEDHLNGVEGSTENETVSKGGSSAWGVGFLGFRLGRGGVEPQAEERTEQQQQQQVCVECEMDGTEGCLVVEGATVTEESDTSVELPHVQVAHDRESFSRFLQRVSLEESRVIARMSHLCKLAYQIRDIKPEDLLVHQRLSWVTSSLDKKTEILAKERESSTSSDDEGERKQSFFINPGSAYALASAVASYLESHAKSLLRLKKESEALQKLGDGSSAEVSSSSTVQTDYESSEMASFIASSPVTAVVAAKEGTKDAVAKDLQSLHNCPCEWYCCDDKQDLTRYFVIQGSESLASWQANLLFEPTHFEDSSLGVMVHRGIYEAAKGLYEQLLPCVLEHLHAHGEQARFCFTGHSLGGSLATLASLMLQIRGVLRREALQPVLTFGSPCIMCGGDYLLEKLGLPTDHVRSVMLHRDIVPRTFACNYPDHVAEILKRLNGSFRDHPCLNNQRLLYAPMGQFLILQPSEADAPPHPLLPSGLGLYIMKHPRSESDVPSSSYKVELRAAQRAFLNSPHPLEILSDRASYGSEGSISRDHNPANYMKFVTKVVREEAKKSRKLKRKQRRSLWWPLMTAELSTMFIDAEQAEAEIKTGTVTGEKVLFRRWMPTTLNRRKNNYHEELMGVSHQGQVVLVFFLSAKLMLMQGFATFFAWV